MSTTPETPNDNDTIQQLRQQNAQLRAQLRHWKQVVSAQVKAESTLLYENAKANIKEQMSRLDEENKALREENKGLRESKGVIEENRKPREESTQPRRQRQPTREAMASLVYGQTREKLVHFPSLPLP